MQEVTVKPRTFFKHIIQVDQPNREIVWSFCTRKKNIAFGLVCKGTSGEPAWILSENKNIPRFNSRNSVGGDADFNLRISQGSDTRKSSVSAATHLKANSHQERSNLSTNDPLVAPKQSELLPDYYQVIPMAHYESSKSTIKGSFFVKEPGEYALIFDNTFSVNTSKKLFFFVGLKDVDINLLPHRREMQGWMLKKANHAMQGYQKRWVELQANGVMSYFRNPGGTSHGSINLSNCAVRADHDNWLIDVDSGKSIFHFKLEDGSDFQRWVGALQQFLPHAHSVINLKELGNQNSRLSIRTKDSEIATAFDDNLSILEQSLLTLNLDLSSIKTILDSQKKGSAKELANQLSSLMRGLTNTANIVSKQLATLSEHHSRDISRVLYQKNILEEALSSCLLDANRTRERFGLNPVSASKYITINNGEIEHVAGLDKQRIASTASSLGNASELFYDAEECDGFDSSSSSYSMHEVEELSLVESPKAESPNLLRRKTSSNDIETSTELTQIPQMQTTRRKRLPAPPISLENFSVMGLLRNNVGKDLSTVSMPIILNEPINLLQKICEELEYSELLDKAAQISDPVERICVIAGFVVSGYASTVHRTARKPFNPLLGETFEYDCPEKGFRFISEKVSHHPPVMAAHAESENFVYHQDPLMKTKFWVTTSMRNVFSNNRYLEHHGIMKIVGLSTGHYCQLVFKESGYFTSANNEVVGDVFSPSGKKLISLSGQWDKSLNKYDPLDPNSLSVIWRAKSFPIDYADNFGFSSFAIQLNELLPGTEHSLPNTDTRFRTDQRLYEQGKLEEAEKEKHRLEHKQREFRKTNDSQTKKWSPQWFVQVKDEHSESGKSWVYAGKYWESKGSFKSRVDLYS